MTNSGDLKTEMINDDLTSLQRVCVQHTCSSRRVLQRLPEQASDPPHLALSQCCVPRHHSATACSLCRSARVEQAAVATSSS